MARAGDDVAFGLENRCLPAEAIWPRVDAALQAVGFGYGRDRPTDALSGGEQQRLAIAGVLALRPGLLLLDEPTANLDPDGAAAIREVVASVVERLGLTLVMVEHRVADALPLVDRVVAIEAGGGVMADGRPYDVFARHGDALAEAGVWVPDRRLPAPPRRPRPEPETLLLAEQVAFRYPGSVISALARTDLQVRAAEAVAITGPNGSGKSTLAMLLAGLLPPTFGIVVAGEALARGRGHEPIWRWPAQDLVRYVGTVFQDPEHQFLTGRVRDELMLGPRRIGLDEPAARRRADELLTRLHLDHAGGGQSLHPVRRREAAAVGGHRAGHGAIRPHPGRADLRAGPPHRRRAARPAGCPARLRSRHRLRHPRPRLRHRPGRSHPATDAGDPDQRGAVVRLFTPLRPNPNALLARANPVAKLAAALLLMTVLFLSVDPVTPVVILAGLAGSRLAVRARLAGPAGPHLADPARRAGGGGRERPVRTARWRRAVPHRSRRA